MADVPEPPPRVMPETVKLSSPDGEEGAAPAPHSPASGQAFGDYELLSEVARGGMGVVYQARERHSGRLVALKMMLDQSASSPADLSRFVLEAQAAGELNHPGVVAIHAWGVHDNHPFYTMDFVPGEPLHRLLAAGPLPVERAVHFLRCIAEALAAAHALGIVHRDLKPSNIMIDPSDAPRVLDFGLAKRRRADLVIPPADEVLDALSALAPLPVSPTRTPRVSAPITEKGAILGTPSYMAPEQVRAEHHRVGPPADVYSLGAIFYEMLTGRPPFQEESTYATLMKVLNSPPPPVQSLRPEVPAPLAAVLRRCLEKDPRDRYPDAAALAEDLEQRWQHSSHSPRHLRLVVLAAAGLLALQVVRPLLVGGSFWQHGGVEGLVVGAARGVHELQDAAGVLDRVLYGLVGVAGPLLAGLGLLLGVGAWVWHSDRPVRLCLGWVAAAALVLAACRLLELPLWPPDSTFLAWALAINAVTAGIACAFRRSLAGRRVEDEGVEGGSYLQKLFAARGKARPRKGGLAGPGGAAETADFEMGPRLHAWEQGAVHWARQKSLDRPVLVWRAGGAEGARPGVVVRHPCVLGLHAITASPDGWLLVTEPVAASPLSEVLQQRPLTAREAVTLGARLADALQAFHDQGACHGRLRADWVLVRGDLEPVLCPCGVPSQSEEDRRQDVRTLARLLCGWLPPRPFTWRYETMAPVYQVCDAAAEGRYGRAADLAADLERAWLAGRTRWRERWGLTITLVLLLLPWLVLVVQAVIPGQVAIGFLAPALLGLCPASLLFGYITTRSLVQGRRLGGASLRAVPKAAYTVAFAVLAAALGGHALGSLGQGFSAGLALAGTLVGFSLCGALAAAGVTFGEVLLGTLRREAPAPQQPEG